MLSAIVAAFMAAQEGDLLVKTYSTSCRIDGDKITCVTLFDMKTSSGRVYTAKRVCNLTDKTCKMVAIDR